MIDIGHFALVGAWVLSLYGIIGGIIGAWRKKPAFFESARNSILLVSILTLVSLGSLGALFLNHDYRYAYVWRTSNNEMDTMYLVAAIWGGMDGSMLLWAGIMSVYALFVVRRFSTVPRDLLSWFVPVFSGAMNFFLSVVLFLTNPFRLIPPGSVPTNGHGLNPLLQNPSMLIHPPMLYAGFTGLAIPFTFCIAALLSGNLSTAWIELTRRWTLIAWGFLTAGIVLGGNWAYIVLGWGGFWAWDPVENASFLPWLSATAFLHSAMVQKKRGSLKIWNMSLCILSYLLTVFGTFLTRSGVVQSVHAFAETDVGWIFIAYLVSVLTLVTILMIYRWKELRPESKIESFFSREAAFLFNNLVLLGICFTTLWGVMFPIVSEAVTGKKSVVGPPFFNQVNVPLFLILLFLLGMGSLFSWKRSSAKVVFRNFIKPFAAGSVITGIFLYVDWTRPLAATAFGLCTFVIMTIYSEFHRGIRVRRELTNESVVGGFFSLLRRKPREYGAHIIHLGAVMMAISITASMAFKTERDFSLRIGANYQVGRYQLALEDLQEKEHPNYTALSARVKLSDANGKSLGYLMPERRFYKQNEEESTTEVDIRMRPLEDVYLALAGINVQEGKENDISKAEVVFKVFINPLQIWLWIGTFVVIFGTLIVIGKGVTKPAMVESMSPAEVKARV